MIKSLKEFLHGLIYENGFPSRTGFIALAVAIIPLIVWTLITIALFIIGIFIPHHTFPHYDTMTLGAFGSSGAGGATAVGNKYINSTKNSPPMTFPDKGEPKEEK